MTLKNLNLIFSLLLKTVMQGPSFLKTRQDMSECPSLTKREILLSEK